MKVEGDDHDDDSTIKLCDKNREILQLSHIILRNKRDPEIVLVVVKPILPYY